MPVGERELIGWGSLGVGWTVTLGLPCPAPTLQGPASLLNLISHLYPPRKPRGLALWPQPMEPVAGA